MSLLSKPSSSSRVREFAEDSERRARDSDKVDLEALFGSMTYCLATFLSPQHEELLSTGQDGEVLKVVGRKYSGDASLFEIGCYLWLRTDLWLFDNRPECRDEISDFLACRFCELLTDALKTDTVSALFDQRIRMYGKLVREGPLETMLKFYLPQLVLRTADNALPKAYRFGSGPVLIVDAFERFHLEVAIAAFDQGMVPAFLKTVDNVIAYLKSEPR